MKAASLFQQVMGPQFARLPAPLQHFHGLQGDHVLHGWVEVGAPASLAARLLARCIGAPVQPHQGPIRFELKASAQDEVWARQFPGKTMTSRLACANGHIVERLGLSELRLALAGDADSLEMKLVQMRFLGIPCPRWLLPTIVARETAEPGRLHFLVEASLPVVGLVTRYRGYLEVGDGASG